MKLLCQQVREFETREYEPTNNREFGKTNQAKKLIIQSLIPLKTWAIELGVTERMVQMWASGTKEIPPARVQQILRISPYLLIAQKEALDREILELLILAYGAYDPGVF